MAGERRRQVRHWSQAVEAKRENGSNRLALGLDGRWRRRQQRPVEPEKGAGGRVRVRRLRLASVDTLRKNMRRRKKERKERQGET